MGGAMERLFYFTMVILTVAFIVSGCGITTSITPAEQVEIWSVINRYLNSLFSLQYSQAKACLYPGGPTDKNLDVVYGQMESAFSYYINIGCPPAVAFEITNIYLMGQQAFAEMGDVTVCMACSLIGTSCETSDMYSGQGMLLEKYNGQWLIY